MTHDPRCTKTVPFPRRTIQLCPLCGVKDAGAGSVPLQQQVVRQQRRVKQRWSLEHPSEIWDTGYIWGVYLYLDMEFLYRHMFLFFNWFIYAHVICVYCIYIYTYTGNIWVKGQLYTNMEKPFTKHVLEITWYMGICPPNKTGETASCSGGCIPSIAGHPYVSMLVSPDWNWPTSLPFRDNLTWEVWQKCWEIPDTSIGWLIGIS